MCRKIESEHAAIHFIHVDQAAADVVLAVRRFADTADGHPTDPFVLRFGLAFFRLDKRADAGIAGHFQTNADLVVLFDIGLVRANPNPTGRKVDEIPEIHRFTATPIPAIHAERLSAQFVSTMLAALGTFRFRGQFESVHFRLVCQHCHKVSPNKVPDDSLNWSRLHPLYRQILP